MKQSFEGTGTIFQGSKYDADKNRTKYWTEIVLDKKTDLPHGKKVEVTIEATK